MLRAWQYPWRVRLTEFWARMRAQFGEVYAQSVAKDYVFEKLGGRTIDRALADPDCPTALRARLLAQRASALAELGDLEVADTDSAAAMTAAVAAGEPAAELDAIRARVAARTAAQ